MHYGVLQKFVKFYPLSAISEDSWKEIDFLFWRYEIPCLPKGASGDGFLAETIESNKRGIEISGVMTFLGGKTGYFECRMLLSLSRPNFSSVESVTPDKVSNALLADSDYDGNTLHVTFS